LYLFNIIHDFRKVNGRSNIFVSSLFSFGLHRKVGEHIVERFYWLPTLFLYVFLW
jgi:hypothetical protein